MSTTDYEVRVDVSIRNYAGGGDLRLSDSVTIPDCSFADMADILRGFHEMAQAIRAAKGKT